MVQNDYGRVSADFENWRKQQEAAQQAALEQQRIAEEQQRAAQVAAEQQRQQAEAMRQMQAAQQEQAQREQAMQQAQQMQTQQIPTLAQPSSTPSQPTPNYAEQAKAIGLPWSPDDADYVQQINDYNARVNGLKQTAAERQATTDALRAQIAQNPELLVQGKQNVANDKQLNNLADQLNAFYAKQNKVSQDEAQKAYTTAVLRTQIAQNPELFANAVAQFAPKGRKSGGRARSKETTVRNSADPYTPPYVTEETYDSIGALKRADYEQLKKKIDKSELPKQPKNLTKEEKAVANDIEKNIADKVSKWINPDNKLSKEEIQEAKTVVDNYNKSGSRQGVRNGVVWGDTPEAKEEAENIQALSNKINPVAAFASGVVRRMVPIVNGAAQAVPSVLRGVPEAIQNIPKLGESIVNSGSSDWISDDQKKEASKSFGNAEASLKNATAGMEQSLDSIANRIEPEINRAVENSRANLKNTKTQNPIAYGAGDAAEQMTEQMMLGAVMPEIPGLNSHASNMITGQLADNLVQIVPDTLEKYDNGVRGNDLAREVLMDEATNALWNVGGEFVIPSLFNGIGKAINGKNTAQAAEEAVENTAKSAPISEPIPSIKPEPINPEPIKPEIDTLASQQKQAAETIENLTEQVPDVPKSEWREFVDNMIDTRNSGELATPGSDKTDIGKKYLSQLDAHEQHEKDLYKLADEMSNDPEAQRLKEEVRKYSMDTHKTLRDVRNPVNPDVIIKHQEAMDNLENYLKNASMGDSIRSDIKGLEMPDEARTEIENLIPNRDEILSRIGKAQSEDEVNSILNEVKSTTDNADSILRKNAATRTVGKYDFDDATRSFAEAIDGRQINITPEMKAELNITNVSDLNNQLYFSSNGKRFKPKFTTKPGKGTPIDVVFHEIDDSTGGAISNFMRSNGMDPEVPENLAKGMRDYASYLKSNKDANKLQEYTGGMFDEFMDSVQKAGNDKIASLTARSVDQTNGPAPNNLRVSDAYNNTLKNSGAMSDEEIAENTLPQYFLMEPKTETESVEEAIKAKAKEGDKYVTRLLKKDGFSQVDTDGMMLAWKDKIAEARALEETGEDATTAWNQANTIFRKIQQEATRNAQALQALAKWSRNTPEGMLSEAERIVNRQIGRNSADKGLPKLLKDTLSKTETREKFKFSPDFQKKFLGEAEAIQRMTPDSREIKEAYARIGAMVNDEIRRNLSVPKLLGRRITSLLMDNMLGNFRTLITRNAGGNLGLAAVEQVATRPLAAGIDKLVAKKTGKRIQAGLSRQALMDYLSGFKKGLSEELQDVKTGLHTSRSGEISLDDAIARNVNINKTDSQNKLLKGLSKVGQFYDNAVAHGLSVGDRPFYEANYKQMVGDMYRLRDQGVLGKDVQGLSDKNFKTFAEGIAKLKALEAVYQNDSLMSDALLGFKKAIGEFSEAGLGFDILSQFSMPFVKTPANVIDRAVDYSPIGAVRNIVRTAREGGIGGEDFNQGRFVNETARNIIGTGMMGAAGAAAANGYISGKYSKDKDQKAAQKAAGMQEYAANIPVNEDESYQMDVSWIPILGSNAVASAAAVNAANDPDLSPIDKTLAGLKGGGKAMYDQAMFQGMQRLFGQGDSYDSDEGIVGNMITTVKQGATQAVPSLLRQATQVADPYQRDVANGDYDLNNIKNTIPGARQTIQPRVNSEGEYVKENQGRNIGSKFLEDMILPGKITHVKYTDLDKEAQRLQGITGNAVAYQPKPSRKDITTDTYSPTDEEYTQYQVDINKATTETAKELLKSDIYKNVSPELQESALSSLYTGIKDYTKSKYAGTKITSKVGMAYEKGNAKAALKEIENATLFKKYDLDNNESNAKVLNQYGEAGLKAKADYNKQMKGADDDTKETKLNAVRKLSQNEQKLMIPQLIKSKEDEKNWQASHENPTQFWKMYDAAEKKKNADFEGSGIDPSSKKDLQKELASYGANDTASTVKYYAHAKQVIPSLTTKQYADTLYKIGGSDYKIKQDEMLAYFNNNNLSDSEINTYWNAYGNWKTIPKLKNGVWRAQRK